jgi:flagella basal body P-ring formation protein FlgA
MRQFILPLILIAIGAPNIEETILSHLNQYYPIPKAQYVCDASNINTMNFPQYDSVAVDGFGKDNPSGQVVVRLSLFKNNERVQKLTSSVRIGIIKQVLVAVSPIRIGEQLTDEKVRYETRDISLSEDGPLDSVAQVNGLVASHFIPIGRMLTMSAFKRLPTLSNGNHVNIRYSKGPLTLDTEGIAREDGSIGEKIRVMNSNSKKIITAVVVDSTTVAIGEGL